MDIPTLSSSGIPRAPTPAPRLDPSGPAPGGPAQPGAAPQVGANAEASESKREKSGVQAEVAPDALEQAAESANKAMEALNTDLHFALHDKTKMMMVQVVREKDGTVLREFPPKEFLDMLAKLKDMVGAFIDERA